MIVACLKWTSPDDGDERFAGVSRADRAALEVALRAGETFGLGVLALAAGPPAADRALRDALACGAAKALRLDTNAAPTSRDVAALLGATIGDARLVICGDHSLDRGSGSVPAFLAHQLGAAQALGLVAVDLNASSIERIHGVRRLDGGRREVLSIPTPCVLSVESPVATLRRASLRRVRDADRAVIEVHPTPLITRHEGRWTVRPFRPRARVLPAPAAVGALDRIRELTDAGTAPARGETIELPPREAAARIATALSEWGYLG